MQILTVLEEALTWKFLLDRRFNGVVALTVKERGGGESDLEGRKK